MTEQFQSTFSARKVTVDRVMFGPRHLLVVRFPFALFQKSTPDRIGKASENRPFPEAALKAGFLPLVSFPSGFSAGYAV